MKNATANRCSESFFVKIIAVIPARYDSTRLAGKVLLKETGKYVIQHTYESAIKASRLDSIIIAADDPKVISACAEFGAQAVMTSRSHQSGTDRIAEAVKNSDADIIINIQGDEPEIDPSNIDAIADLMINNPQCQMGTLVAGFDNLQDIQNPDIVKCIVDNSSMAIYFSRYPIPYCRDVRGIGDKSLYLRHIGIYAYRKDFLNKFTALPQSNLEKIEKLEQLRAIENGFRICTAKVNHTCAGIDTPEQYKAFVERQNKR
jgi:3-deoxy-manno-octulosonate cytidylyltransferase (CMP-KDO synthetase)